MNNINYQLLFFTTILSFLFLISYDNDTDPEPVVIIEANIDGEGFQWNGTKKIDTSAGQYFMSAVNTETSSQIST